MRLFFKKKQEVKQEQNRQETLNDERVDELLRLEKELEQANYTINALETLVKRQSDYKNEKCKYMVVDSSGNERIIECMGREELTTDEARCYRFFELDKGRPIEIGVVFNPRSVWRLKDDGTL